VLRWGFEVVREIAHGPTTVRRARQLLGELADLPGQLERVVRSVEDTTSPLSGSLEDVAEALSEIRDRLEHLDTVIWHLRDTVFAVVAAVPGGRRALDRLPSPPPAPLTRPHPADDEGALEGEGYDAAPCSDTDPSPGTSTRSSPTAGSSTTPSTAGGRQGS
jgi:ABC-type transporter Mla subunit MlaD